MFDSTAELPPFEIDRVGGMPIKGQNFSGTQFRSPPVGTHFIECDFSQTQWEGVSLDGQIFTQCRFDGSSFAACNLKGVRFFNCTAERFVVNQSLLTECHWEGGQWIAFRWLKSKLLRLIINAIACSAWEFKDCNINFLTMSTLKVDGVRIEDCVVQDMSLVESEVRNQFWHNIQMDRVILANSLFHSGQWSECRGGNNRWMGVRGELLEYRSCQFEQCAWSRCEIDQSVYHGNSLRVAYFDNSRLQNLFFKGNSLYMLAFDNALLSASTFQEKDASYISFRNARLEACDLRDITVSDFDVRGCSLHETRVDGARFTEANMIGQNPSDWHGADVDLARFEVPEDQQDSEWWELRRPGATKEMR